MEIRISRHTLFFSLEHRSRDFAKTIYFAFRCFEKIKVKVFSTLKVLYQHQRIISKVFLAWKCEDYSMFYTYHNHPLQFQLEFCFVFNFFCILYCISGVLVTVRRMKTLPRPGNIFAFYFYEMKRLFQVITRG